MPHKDPEARKAYNKAYHAAYRDRLIQRAQDYRAANREHLANKAKDRYALNLDKVVAKALDYQKEHPGEAGARNALCRLRKINRVPVWLDEDDIWLMQEAYILAKERIKSTGMRWDVDHIYPTKGKTVSGLHVPSNLRVVPYQMNKVKRNKMPEKFSASFIDYL